LLVGTDCKSAPAANREAYHKRSEESEKELMLRYGQYQIDYVDADINQGYHPVLLAYLLKRSRMY
jgi:hypothetical protein